MVLHPLPGVEDALPVCVIQRNSENFPFPWQEVRIYELGSTANFMIGKCKGKKAIHGNTMVPGQGNGRHITHRAPDRHKVHWTNSLLSHRLNLSHGGACGSLRTSSPQSNIGTLPTTPHVPAPEVSLRSLHVALVQLCHSTRPPSWGVSHTPQST